MTEIIDKLPNELANIVYSYVGKSDTAKMIQKYLLWKEVEETSCYCFHCGNDFDIKLDTIYEEANGHVICEYCYAEELGEDVYTCCKCNDKTYTFGKFNNTEEDRLFCNCCYEFYLEELEESESEN